MEKLRLGDEVASDTAEQGQSCCLNTSFLTLRPMFFPIPQDTSGNNDIINGHYEKQRYMPNGSDWFQMTNT